MRPGDSGSGTPGIPAAGLHPAPVPEGTPEENLVPLDIKLPRALVGPTPKNIKPSPHLEPYSDKPRPVFKVPAGTVNLAAGRAVTASDPNPVVGELKQLTDGDKEGEDGSYVDLGPGRQWVQIDLGEPCVIYAVAAWHYHAEKRVYHDVVVQAADDPDFIENVQTIYNNDFDNSSGLGVGKDLEYIEDYRGRLFDARGVRGRFLRLYSNGNSSNDLSNYIEVEVYGKPAAPAPGGKAPAAPAAATRTSRS
ncbi:MAG: hypothetical protein FJ288_06630 [Planctomycetes bacterium]|nr:hypothetical protein [Planctomycetota bacterium]